MRLFIAIELTDAIKIEIEKIVNKLREADCDVKWVRREGMHITLKFLGEVEEDKKNKIEDILVRVAGTTAPFKVSFRGIGAFPDLRRPRVLWIGIEDGGELLKEVAEKLEASLDELNFPGEKRAFFPHLTLGRARSNAGIEELKKAMAEEEKFILPELNVSEIILMQSILKKEGAEYRKVMSYKLQERRG
jgi:2'-5' RNA ligase